MAAMPLSDEDAKLASQCLEFCQTLADKSVEARCERSSHMCGLGGCFTAATQSTLWKSELSDKWTNGLEFGKK